MARDRRRRAHALPRPREGTPILFLHGSGTGVTAAANWWLNLPELSRYGRCIAIDSIGYGQSVVADGTRTASRNGSATRCASGCARHREDGIVGNSLGGWLAFQFAIDYPDRLLGIVSMGTGGAKLTGALAAHSNPTLTEDGIRKTLEMFVVDKSWSPTSWCRCATSRPSTTPPPTGWPTSSPPATGTATPCRWTSRSSPASTSRSCSSTASRTS
ncbi:alpha/beta fold hydrolase [Rhodococcus hoagii]|nr:alpha/beta fold hydrolase [Prescottella equi]NKZ88108.1 alpha/beta fold hydrolase [Prescottella equi]